jgi:hypothetical protein
MRRNQWPVLLAVVACFCLLVACSPSSAAQPKAKPAEVQEIPGSDLKRLVLQPQAVQRLGIQMGSVEEQQVTPPGNVAATPVPQLVIPYSAVIYDPNGGTWTYVSGSPGTYERQPITIQYIVGNMAVLSAGPPSGTSIVTVGAALLYGEETGVGH